MDLDKTMFFKVEKNKEIDSKKRVFCEVCAISVKRVKDITIACLYT